MICKLHARVLGTCAHTPSLLSRSSQFLFEATEYEGELLSSDEGKMHWVKEEKLGQVNLVKDFQKLIDVMLNDQLSEFQYVIENGKWNVVKK